MMIKDLEMSKDLDREALSAVRGGSNYAQQFGIADASVTNASGGFSLGSPTVITNAPAVAQSVNQSDNDLDLDITTKTANVLGSAFTGIFQ